MSTRHNFSFKGEKWPVKEEEIVEWNKGWGIGYEWVLQNHHIDGKGQPNCKGDFMKHFDKNTNIERCGIAEGVLSGLSHLLRESKTPLN